MRVTFVLSTTNGQYGYIWKKMTLCSWSDCLQIKKTIHNITHPTFNSVSRYYTNCSTIVDTSCFIKVCFHFFHCFHSFCKCFLCQFHSLSIVNIHIHLLKQITTTTNLVFNFLNYYKLLQLQTFAIISICSRFRLSTKEDTWCQNWAS